MVETSRKMFIGVSAEIYKEEITCRSHYRHQNHGIVGPQKHAELQTAAESRRSTVSQNFHNDHQLNITDVMPSGCRDRLMFVHKTDDLFPLHCSTGTSCWSIRQTCHHFTDRL